MGTAVIKIADRRKVSTDEATFAEYVPLDNGGIAIITELDGHECVWELNRAQTEIVIRALTLAFVTRRSVRIAQPFSSAA